MLQKQESLSSLTLQCRNLIDVDLSDCESLTNAICEVFSDGGGCPMLRSLILDNCEVWCVTFMRSLCFKLEKISCYLNASELWYYSTLLSFFLRFLLSVVPSIHVFSRYLCQSIYYTEILMMYFSFQSLSIVELNSSSLVSLSLAGCRSMTFLRLSCPNLQNVNLDGCDHLQSAAFCPVSLLISSEVQY